MSTELTTQPAEPVYESLQGYMDMRDGTAAPDDVMLAPSAEPAAVAVVAPLAAPALEAVPASPPGTAPVAPAVPADVSAAARTLSQQRGQTKAERRVSEIQTTIDTLTAAKHRTQSEVDAAKRELDTLRAEAARLRTSPAPAAEPAPAPAAPAPAATRARPEPPKASEVGNSIPDWDAFSELNQQWTQDLADWTQEQATITARKTVDETLAQERQKVAQDVAVSAYESRLVTARERHSDFDAVAFGDYPIHQVLAGQIMTDPHGPDVAYFLGSHPDEARRIAALPIPMQLVEYGAIRAQVRSTAAPAASAGTVVSATPGSTSPALPRSLTPPPTSPVGGAPTASKVPLEQQSISQYIEERNAEEDRYRRR